MSDSRCRVVLVGIDFAPEQTGIAPYTTGMARHLAEHGNRVLVLTGTPHPPTWVAPAELHGKRRGRAERDGGITVRRLDTLVSHKQQARSRVLYEATFGAQVARQRLPWRPDAVIAVVPSLAGAAAASWRARGAGAPYAVVVQDLMGPSTAASGVDGSHAARLLEARVLRSAQRVAVTSEPFRSVVRGYGVPAERIDHMPNWCHVEPSTADRWAVRHRMGWARHHVIALHAGNMGEKHDLSNVLEAARLAESVAPDVHFVLLGEGRQRRRLQAQAGRYGNCSVLPPARAEDYVDVLAAADVLLVNEGPGAAQMSLPFELTSYLVAGRPIVAAAPIGRGTAREVARSGAGCVVPPANPAALLHAVRHLAADDGHARLLGRQGRRHAAWALGEADARARTLALLHSLTSPDTV